MAVIQSVVQSGVILTFSSGNNAGIVSTNIDPILEDKYLYGIYMTWSYFGVLPTEIIGFENITCDIQRSGNAYRKSGDVLNEKLWINHSPIQMLNGDNWQYHVALSRQANATFSIVTYPIVFYSESNLGQVIPNEIIKNLYP